MYKSNDVNKTNHQNKSIKTRLHKIYYFTQKNYWQRYLVDFCLKLETELYL